MFTTALYNNGIKYEWGKAPKPITQSGIYWSSSLGLISLSSNGTDWITIADKNLGATTVYNDGDTLSEANCGKYYQWGNNYGFAWTGSVTTSSTKVDASSYGPGNYYSSSTFIKYEGNWSTVRNDNLWGGTTGTNEAMQGPCANGYHIPTSTEWNAIVYAGVVLGAWGSSGGDDFRIKMKMPFAGERSRTSSVYSQGSRSYYWSSTAYSDNNAYYLLAYSSTLNPLANAYRAYGYSIRPFKNEPVQPTEARTKLN